MEKSKRIIIAVTIVTVGILFFGIYKMVNVNDDINEGEDISEYENKRENNELLGISKEDNKQIIANYIFIENLSDDNIPNQLKLKPVKEISNPIDHEFGNEEVNKFLKATDLINNTYDIDMNTYVKDTEGFYDIEGLN